MKTVLWMLVAMAPSWALAQQPSTIDIRVSGTHSITRSETRDSATQLALVDAESKILQEAVTHLQGLADVKALKLKPSELEAYLAGILDIPERPTTSATARRDVYQVDMLLRLDISHALRRLASLRKDQEASIALVEAWEQMQELRQQLADQTRRLAAIASGDATKSAQERQVTVTALRVKQLVARVTEALARTEERTVGGRVPSREGRERAKQLAEVALAMSPDSADAHFGMGDVLIDAGKLQAAEAEYRTALRGDPESASGHIKLANALLLEGNLSEAVVQLRNTLRIAPATVRAHSDLGLVLANQGNVSGAMSEYREALRLDPDFVDAHNGLAIILARQDRLQEAVTEFREIVRIDPDSAIGHYNLSYALADMDKDEESAAALREVVRINPNHYNARYNLGELFRLEGKFDESANQFREYVRLVPDTPENQRNIERARNFIKSFENQ